jgi:1,4-dihydroxy-2-naphthoyl-CoA synthase
MTEFTDITYEVDNGLAWITINRPERYNAFRARTLDGVGQPTGRRHMFDGRR